MRNVLHGWVGRGNVADMPATTPDEPLREDELYSTAAAAAWLGVHPATITRWVQAGRLTPAIQGAGKRGAMFFTGADITALKPPTT